MAKELLVSVAIGAALQGSYLATFSGAKRTLGDLGKTADSLRKQHGQMGKELARAMASPKAGIGDLRQQYDRLGQSIERVHARHKALSTSMQRGQELKDARQEHIGGIKESAATAVAIGAPLLGSVKQAAKFEAGLRDIAITGNLKAQEEIALGETLRQSALVTNQGHEAIMQGVNTLVAQGMNATEAGKYSALLGKTATATNAEMNDLAKMMFSLSNSLGIKGEANLKEALNRAAYGAKLGQFELKAMSQYLPTLTSTFAAKGIKGQEALTQIIASLEVGRSAAGTDGEAVTNLVNWMSHMNTEHTSKAYGKAGVNYQQSMQNLVAQGYSSYEASLQIADKFITGKGDAFMAEWQKAGKAGDENAQRQLMESFGLNEVFTDIQTINHLLAMRQNWDKYQQNKKQMGSSQALGTIDEDYTKRAQTAQKAWERFTTQITDVAITIGSVFLPALSDALDGLAPVIRNFGAWAKENPGVLRGLIGLVGGIVALRTAAFGLKFLGNFMFLAPANSIGTAWGVLTSRFAIFRALMAGGTARFPLMLQFFGMGADRASKFGSSITALTGATHGWGATVSGQLTGSIQGAVTAARTWIITQGAWVRANLLTMSGIRGLVGSMAGPLLGRVHAVTAAMRAWTATSWSWVRSNLLTTAGIRGLANSMAGALLGRFQAATTAMRVWTAASLSWVRTNLLTTAGLRGLAASFGGQLVSGIRTATVAVRAFSLALLTNPIGIAVAVIGGAAFLVYKYWQPIKGFFAGLWQGLRSGLAPLMPAFRQLASVASAAFVPLMPPLRAVWGWLKNIFLQANDTGGAARNLGVAVGQGIASAIIWVGRLVKSVFDLPGKFIRLGGDIVDGLVNGIKTKFGAARDTIVQFGSSIKGWFTSTLGIKSPSRVFMGFGDNIAQGAAIGIGRTAGMVAKATTGMALATTTAWGQPALPVPTLGAFPAINNTMQMVHQRILPATPTLLVPRLPTVVPPGSTPEREHLAERVKEARTAAPTTGTAGSAPAAMHIVFSPQITLQPGTPKEVQQQVSQAMQLSFAEFERMMKRYEADKKRRSYGGNS